jgi:hypothetical protein
MTTQISVSSSATAKAAFTPEEIAMKRDREEWDILRDNRVAITVGSEPSEVQNIKAVYAGCEVFELGELPERAHAWDLLAQRHPNLTDLAPPQSSEVATMVARCRHVSVLDYTQGLGHTESVTVS